MNTTPVISVRLITHPQRLLQAVILQDFLLRERFAEVQVILDKEMHGAKATHIKALQAPSKRDDITHILIIEDDAWPVQDFKLKVEEKITAFPQDLISIYLGTGKPARWQQVVDTLITGSEPYSASISLSMLIHGVAYLAPIHIQELFKDNPATLHEGADFHVGQVWHKATKRQIIYPVYSLVQHEDGGASINTPSSSILRVARKLDIRALKNQMKENEDG